MKIENGFYWITYGDNPEPRIARIHNGTCFLTGSRFPLAYNFYVLSERLVFEKQFEEPKTEQNPEPKDTFEENRQKLWIKAFSSVANAFNCTSSKTAIQWADYALSHFDKIFKK